jgi:CheY-like chemotaxis protein
MSLILVVDDEEPLRTLLEKMLKQAGHDVVAVGSSKEAVRSCQERRFDLVITDMAMPDMGGLELIHSLRGSHKDLPVLAISGVFYRGFLKTATALGAVGTLKKPFTQRDLLAIVNKSLGRQPE